MSRSSKLLGKLMNRRTQNTRYKKVRSLRIESLDRRELMAADLGASLDIGVLRNQQLFLNTDNDPAAEIDTTYGLAGDKYLTGKFTKNGGTTPVAVRTGADGLLHWFIDTDGDPEAERTLAFGLPGDTPVVGDWDGDGIDDIGVVRQGHDGLLRWYLNLDDDPTHEKEFVYGLNTDMPIVGDWDGNGIDDAGAIRKQPDGLLHWYLDTDRDPAHEKEVIFGLHRDQVISGDWDNNGKDNVGVVRAQPDGYLHWYLDTNGDQTHEREYIFGLPGDQPLVGKWKLSELSITGLPANRVLNFGSYVPVGSPAVNRTFAVENTGTRKLTLRFEVPAGFEAVGKATVQPGQRTAVTIRMLTQQAGPRNGTLRVHTNDGNERLVNVELRGSVGNPPPPSPPDVDVSGVRDNQSAAIELNRVKVGSAAPSKTFVVTNNGEATLTLQQPSVNNGAFKVSHFDRLELRRGESTSFTVTLTSTAKAGSFTTHISFSSNDPDESPFSFDILAEVAPDVAPTKGPEITLIDANGREIKNGGTVSFGEIKQGQAGVQTTLTIRNDGDRVLHLHGLAANIGGPLGGGVDRIEVVGDLTTQLNPGETRRLTVKLNTTKSGSFTEKIRLQNNDADEGLYDITFAGKVIEVTGPPEIEVSIVGVRVSGTSAELNFGAPLLSKNFPEQGRFQEKRIVIRNTGTGTLKLSDFEVSDMELLGYPREVAPGQSTSFSVRLIGGRQGFKEGRLSFRTNDRDEPQFVMTAIGRILPALDIQPVIIKDPYTPVYTIKDSQATQIEVQPANGVALSQQAYEVVQYIGDRVISRMRFRSELQRVEVHGAGGARLISWVPGVTIQYVQRQNRTAVPPQSGSAEKAIEPIDGAQPRIAISTSSPVPFNPDVNGDGSVSPIDVLQVVNTLNTISANPSAVAQNSDPIPEDVNQDGVVSPLDALQIINHLNGGRMIGEGEGVATPNDNPTSSVSTTTLERATRPQQRERSLVSESCGEGQAFIATSLSESAKDSSSAKHRVLEAVLAEDAIEESLLGACGLEDAIDLIARGSRV